jgi:bacillithiol synthase
VQLKEVFEEAKILFPILLPRNHVLYISQKQQEEIKRKLTNKGLPLEAIFLPFEQLKKLYLDKVLQNPTQILPEIAQINKQMEEITKKIQQVDASLEKYAKAQQTALNHLLNKMSKKLQKAQEHRFTADLRQLEALHQSLCPHNGLQERTDNVLSFSLNNPNFLQEIQKKLQPFEHHFLIVAE